MPKDGDLVPVAPPPAMSGAGLFAGAILLGGLGALVVIEAMRHPTQRDAILAHLEGPDNALGPTPAPDSRVGRPPRRNAVNRAVRVPARRAGVPTGESGFGSGL